MGLRPVIYHPVSPVPDERFQRSQFAFRHFPAQEYRSKPRDVPSAVALVQGDPFKGHLDIDDELSHHTFDR